MKNVRVFLTLVGCLFLLTGCWDRTEINDMAFVVASGVDKGANKTFKMSIEIPLPSSLGGAGSSGGGGGTSGEGPFFIAQGTGANSRRGLEDIQDRLSRKLYFGHRRVIIIGEDLAKEGITEVLNFVFMQPQSRISTFLLVSKGDAVNLLQTKPRMEQYSGEAVREMAKANINMTVKEALLDLERPGKSIVVPVIQPTGPIKEEKKGTEIKMANYAVFNKDKLAFMTNDDEARAILWLNGKMRQKLFTFPALKNKEITLQITDSLIKPNFRLKNGKPAFDLHVSATGILLENEPNLRIEDPETYHMIVRKMEKEVGKEISGLLKHAHSEGSDVYGFGWNIYRNHYRQWKSKWEANWQDTLKDLEVNVNVDADIQRTTTAGKVEKD